MMYFIQLVVQSKDANDYRAFLYYRESFDSKEELEIRGYGDSAIKAAEDAVNTYTLL